MKRGVNRRVRQVFIRDWLEIWLTALGLLAGSSIRTRVRQIRGTQRPPAIPPREHHPRADPADRESR